MDESPALLVPSDPLSDIFTPDVLRDLSNTNRRTLPLRDRLEVLTASGPFPSDSDQAHRVKWLRARRAGWATYLEAAFACNLLGGERSADLRSRLVGIDDDNFRSAMAECMTCWFLAGRMKWDVDALASGRHRKMLDMRVVLPDGTAGVEVKAPFRKRPPPNTPYQGNDADKIRICLEAANKQFDKDCMNLLVIAPNLRRSMFEYRLALVHAVYGESVIAFDFNSEEGRLKNQRSEFSPKGRFLKTKRPDGKPLKPEGVPAYQRISAVLCIEEDIREADSFSAIEFKSPADLKYSDANDMRMGHNVLAMHNPYSYNPVSEKLWTEFPQFVRRDNAMVWTDGYDRPI